MHKTRQLNPKEFLWSLLFLAFVLFTNVWLPWDAAIEYMLKQDVAPYVSITQAAPDFPVDKMAFHHAQRFFAPYALGLIAKATNLDFRLFYYAATLFLTVGLVGVSTRIFKTLGLTARNTIFWNALLIACPYFFRYYALVPGMLQGLLFNFGLAVVLLGLLRVNIRILITGAILAALARQTTLLIIPTLVVWMLTSKNWKNAFTLPLRLATTALIVLMIGLIYKGSGWIVTSFAKQSVSSESISGLFVWLHSSLFSVRELAEYVLRVFLPFLVIAISSLGFIELKVLKDLKKARYNNLAMMCFFMALCILAQPLLAGPIVAGQSASRLSTHGLVPFVMGAAYLSKRSRWLNRMSVFEFLGVLSLVFLLSLHHLYSTIGPKTSSQLVAMQVVLALFLAAWGILKKPLDRN